MMCFWLVAGMRWLVCCLGCCVSRLTGRCRVLDSEREQIVRLVSAIGVQVVSADWSKGLLVVRLPQVRRVAGWDREVDGDGDSGT